MPDCINCSKNNLSSTALTQNSEEGCITTVHETVCVQGTVTIDPKVVSGPSKSYCVGNPIIGGCRPGDLVKKCSFAVGQKICVQIPLTFSTTATAVADGVSCGTPGTGDCSSQTSACTHTIGFFKRQTDFTNALIMAAGGSITLGTGAGLSIVVTTDNANDVLDFNPPPPAPTEPPYAGQYNNLYAQLLAANLNVLILEALGVEVCSFIINAIKAANNFIGSSPEGGIPGASTFQEPLEQFNSGEAPGCPLHCND